MACRMEVKRKSRATQNHYFVETEHAREGAPRRGRTERAAQGFIWGTQCPVLFASDERNKIKILLRLVTGYAIIKL